MFVEFELQYDNETVKATEYNSVIRELEISKIILRKSIAWWLSMWT